ncbi:MAG: hypothetical protein DMF49_11385 [Acidobacteria bacterium]|nr:MAG: hypothetical protein DMF49_11385 [Acidobacteriota bacterium]
MGASHDVQVRAVELAEVGIGQVEIAPDFAARKLEVPDKDATAEGEATRDAARVESEVSPDDAQVHPPFVHRGPRLIGVQVPIDDPPFQVHVLPLAQVFQDLLCGHDLP